MPIRPFLTDHSFDPDTLRIMGTAFERACAALGLADKCDRATELVAHRVLDLVKRGERDPERLKAAVVKSFRAGMH